MTDHTIDFQREAAGRGPGQRRRRVVVTARIVRLRRTSEGFQWERVSARRAPARSLRPLAFSPTAMSP